jgi:UDP-N-acetyl-2-amino-2-deoxyglucuronate dehydrogenase
MRPKFALIGYGNIGMRHAEYIKDIGILSAVCDIDKTKADEAGKKYEAAIFYSVEELFQARLRTDIIVICSPNGLHARHSIMALNAGSHVLCEKPMAIRSADCLAMIEAAEKNKKKLFVVKQNRFNPPVAAVKKIIDENGLGRIYSLQLNCFWNRDEKYYTDSWKGTAALDGGILFTQFSHFIDLLYWFFGDVKHVQSIRKNFSHKKSIELEDSGVALLEFENGIIGGINYTVNSYKKNMEGSLTIFGEKGSVKIGGEYLNELEYQEIENYKITDLPAGNKANDYGYYQGSMSNHDKVYKNLVDVLLHNSPMSASSMDGLKTVEIIEKIYKAAEVMN